MSYISHKLKNEKAFCKDNIYTISGIMLKKPEKTKLLIIWNFRYGVFAGFKSKIYLNFSFSSYNYPINEKLGAFRGITVIDLEHKNKDNYFYFYKLLKEEQFFLLPKMSVMKPSI